MKVLKTAFENGTSAEVKIGGRTVIYEPELALVNFGAEGGASAMTLTAENGFILGPKAFSSSEELGKTVLQELHRLNNSIVVKTGEATTANAASTTNAAAAFAEKAVGLLKF
jgi:Mrp family chromosome partitioning ATPase